MAGPAASYGGGSGPGVGLLVGLGGLGGNVVELKNLRPDGTIGEPEPETPEFADYASSEDAAEAAEETDSSDEA